ncbi:MAG: hypothetical protein ACRD29_25950 [Acidimicrobiales bacterium]
MPSGVAYVLRAELRRQWRSWLVIAALIGLASGGVMALVAGALRTDTAYDRFIDRYQSDIFDMAVVGGTLAGLPELRAESVADVDGVQRAVVGLVFAGDVTATSAGARDAFADAYVSPEMTISTDTGVEVSKLLRGRRVDPDHPDEAVVHFTVAEDLGVDVGDTMTVRLLDDEELADFQEQGADFDLRRSGYEVDVEIVGVDAVPGEFPPRYVGQGVGPVDLSPALRDAIPADVARLQFVGVGLEADANPDAVTASIVAETGAVPEGIFTEADTAANTARTNRAMYVQALGLLVLAGVASVALALLLTQALIRINDVNDADRTALRVEGFAPAQFTQLALARTVLLTVTGAAMGLSIAAVASTLFPLGLAGVAEPDPGVRIDAVVLGAGAAITALGLCLLVVLLAGWRARAVGRADRQDRGALASRNDWLASVCRPWRSPASDSRSNGVADEPQYRSPPPSSAPRWPWRPRSRHSRSPLDKVTWPTHPASTAGTGMYRSAMVSLATSRHSPRRSPMNLASRDSP